VIMGRRGSNVALGDLDTGRRHPMNRNRQPPWNPRVPAEITPAEFEELVLAWLRRCAADANQQIDAKHLGVVRGAGGEYKIDVLVRLTVFSGAVVAVLAECKHQARPVEREDAMILEAKLRDVGAHKGMLFSTSGFQKGALQYAAAHGVATVAVVRGKWLYETRAVGSGLAGPPPWVQLDPYAGIRMTPTDKGISCHTIELARVDALTEWLAESARPE